MTSDVRPGSCSCNDGNRNVSVFPDPVSDLIMQFDLVDIVIGRALSCTSVGVVIPSSWSALLREGVTPRSVKEEIPSVPSSLSSNSSKIDSELIKSDF